MRQVFRILTLATAVVVAVPQGSLQAAPGAKDAIAKAREQIASKNLKAAAGALEDALGDSRGDDRKTILGLLKQTYQSLIREAQAAGKSQEVDLYTDDLAILEAQPSPGPTAAAESSAPPSFEPTPVPEPARTPAVPEAQPAPAPKSAPKPATPVSVPRNDLALDPGTFAEPDALSAPNALPPLDAPVADPKAVAAPEKSASPPATSKTPPSLTATDEFPPIRSERPSTRDDSVKTASTTPQPSRIEAPSPPTAAAPSKDLAAADALFNQKRYDQAGKLYAALAAQDRLPSARKKVWAYCRWAAVVARINAHPKSAKEWDEIESEIQSVQVLTPGNDGWYGEYLRDRVAAARRGERPTSRPGKLVVRGAAPEEPEAERKPQPPAPADERVRRAGGEEPLDLPTSTGDGDSANAPSPGTAAASSLNGVAPSWQIHETASFRIYHTDPALAEQAAEAAEAVRARQGTRWGSKGVRGPWSPQCDIYLYPTARDFARMTGQPETSPGFSTMGVSGAQIVARRVNLRADHPQMLSAILPHEVTHVVLADVFTEKQIPRWADEGMAVLAEPASEQAGRASDLNAPLAEQRLFKLSQLMSIDYPEAKHWNLFYAQSVSLTQFLVRQGTAAQFVAFIKSAQQKGPETALREVYKFEGFDDLESRWGEYARQQAAQVATADASVPADSPSPQRQ